VPYRQAAGEAQVVLHLPAEGTSYEVGLQPLQGIKFVFFLARDSPAAATQ